MIIAGAGGHAAELICLLEESGNTAPVYLFDDVSPHEQTLLFGRYKVLRSIQEAQSILKNNPPFALGIGKPEYRLLLAEKLTRAGGQLTSLISSKASIGNNAVELGVGLNIMNGAVITSRIKIGKGTLVHIHCSIHHDVEIGEYCELSPGSRILGSAKIGSMVSVGAGAIILPGITIGDKATIGAGAVVTRNVPDAALVVGIPAKPLNP